jgi:ADP-dependent NAD(P)H-hydrate dehydratase / NAD(P)H-hydrate epimerase
MRWKRRWIWASDTPMDSEDWRGRDILGVREHAILDELAQASGISLETLMENAGRQVANEIAKRWPPQQTFVLCGPGNNGGDGYVVARHLQARGYAVTVQTIGDHARMQGAAKAMRDAWTGPIEAWDIDYDGVYPGLYVDAVYGAGLNRAVPKAFSEFWRWVHAYDGPIVAIDVPSGVHGDTAKFLGDEDWYADLTVTFFRKKPAHVLMPGLKLCGEVVVVDIGIPAGLLNAFYEAVKERALPDVRFALETEAPDSPPRIEDDTHKYKRGHCVVVCGPALATGAARLAARAALRSAAGVVTLAAAPDAALVCAHHVTAEMVRAFDGEAGLRAILADPRVSSVVIGPGLGRGDAQRELVIAALASEASVVLDADALTAFEGRANELFDLIRAKMKSARLDRGVVLPPHEGEFERLFPGLRKRAVNKIEAAKLAADECGAVVVLKGADTVIADPDGHAHVNINAPPWLATAGSGDVLAGIIGGLLADGYYPLTAALEGVWLHGAAGVKAGRGLIASDLPEILPQVFKNIGVDPKNAL